jgi:two-component system, OmpR family, sensor histidine kinase ArlS
MKLQIKGKIMLMNMVIFVPIILIVYALVLNSLYGSLVRSSTEFLLQESYNTQRYIDRYIENQPQSPAEKRFTAAAPLLCTYLAGQMNCRIQVYDKTGSLLSDSVKNELSAYASDIGLAVKGDKAWLLKKLGGTSYVLFSLPIYAQGEIIGCIRYLYPLQREADLMHNMILLMGLVILAAIGISWLLSNLLAERLTNPIRRLRAISENIAQGDYSQKIVIHSGDEVEDLAHTFNQTTQSIRSYIQRLQTEKQKQKRFLDNVTHEFKTPLTAIIGYADLIPRLKNPKDIKESLTYIFTEGNRLLKLVEELLILSRFGRSGFSLEITDCDPGRLVQDALHMLQLRIEAAGIAVETSLPPVLCRIDKDKTLQVLLNILDNALKYSQCNRLRISLERQHTSLWLTIADNGIGIDSEILPTIFEPACRLTAKKSLSGQSNGLGLCICREIMEKQQGSICINNQRGQGTCVQLIFSVKEVPHENP